MAPNIALVDARKRARLSQDGLARRVGCSRLTVIRWEAGLTSPQPALLGALERALDMPGESLGFAGVSVVRESIVPVAAPGDGIAADSAAMASWRLADLRVGGAGLYGVVLSYLQTQMAPRLITARDHGVFTSAAAVTEMAGWMAHDAGHDQLARDHFARALDLAMIGRDTQVIAHVLASAGHVADRLGDHRGTLRACESGLQALAPGNPDLAAYLHAVRARGFAALGEPAEMTRSLALAERALHGVRGEPFSPWVSIFDEGSLANEAARCMLASGQLSEVRRQADRVLALRPPDRPRSRSFGLFMHADVLAATGNPDEAAAIGTQILAITAGLSSYTVTQQFLALGRRLEPHRANSVVSDFLSRLAPAIRGPLPIGVS